MKKYEVSKISTSRGLTTMADKTFYALRNKNDASLANILHQADTPQEILAEAGELYTRRAQRAKRGVGEIAAAILPEYEIVKITVESVSPYRMD